MIRKFLISILFALSVWSADAQKISVPEATLNNVHRVAEGIYRCEQPGKDDFQALEKMGIREVLSLRRWHGDETRARKTGLKLHRLKTRASTIDPMEIEAALKIIVERKGPIVIHCWHGSDRTGAVCAAYRIVVEGMEKEAAIEEMVDGGYGFHKRTFGQIPDVIRSLDVVAMRQKLDLR